MNIYSDECIFPSKDLISFSLITQHQNTPNIEILVTQVTQVNQPFNYEFVGFRYLLSKSLWLYTIYHWLHFKTFPLKTWSKVSHFRGYWNLFYY